MPVLGQPCCELVTTGGEWLAAQCRGCTFVAGHQPTHTLHSGLTLFGTVKTPCAVLGVCGSTEMWRHSTRAQIQYQVDLENIKLNYFSD